MCIICNVICYQIEKMFGHRVDPIKLQELIETSPIPPKDEKEVAHHTDYPKKGGKDGSKR